MRGRSGWIALRLMHDFSMQNAKNRVEHLDAMATKKTKVAKYLKTTLKITMSWVLRVLSSIEAQSEGKLSIF